MYLVLLETSGNQRYIFSTNKLRENVGASELTYKIGAEFAKELAKNTDGIKEIIATSGKALVIADSKKIAEKFVSDVTKHALEFMPGLTVHGAVSKEIKDSTAESLHEAVGEVHKKLEIIRYQIPSNLQRFQRIPFVAECSSSNLPASEVIEFKNNQGNDVFTFSKVSISKREVLATQKKKRSNEDNFEKGRITKELEQSFNLTLPENLEKFEEVFPQTKWLAVVHADGNGLGKIFLSFDDYAIMDSYESYKKDYQNFSDEIDVCTKNAFGKALQNLQTKFSGKTIPVLPVILGGDDLTFICDGEYAISLTKNFLGNFENECIDSKSQTNETIRRITEKTPLGICAGIAIIKPNFPFHQAYELAEELLQSAKKVKNISTSLSAFDYHVLYDSSGTKLEEIREKTPFVARPYIVSENAENLAQNNEQKIWLKNHHYHELAKRVTVMTQKDEDGKNKLPNSQLHILRDGLFFGEAETEARANLIKHRYKNKGFNDLLCEDGKLFFDEDGKRLTHLLDAMDIVELWKGGQTHDAE